MWLGSTGMNLCGACCPSIPNLSSQGTIRLPSVSVVSLRCAAYQAIFCCPVDLTKKMFIIVSLHSGRTKRRAGMSEKWKEPKRQLTLGSDVKKNKRKHLRSIRGKVRDCDEDFTLLDEGSPESSLSHTHTQTVHPLCLRISKQALQNPNKAELMKHDLTAGALVSKQSQNKLSTRTQPDLLSSTVRRSHLI